MVAIGSDGLDTYIQIGIGRLPDRVGAQFPLASGMLKLGKACYIQAGELSSAWMSIGMRDPSAAAALAPQRLSGRP
jgi:hypothetical protein